MTETKEVATYWWRMPVDTDPLMELKPLELKAYMVISRAIQQDRHKGLIAMRQIQERTHSGSLGRTQQAVDVVCSRGFFTRHNPKTGVRLTNPEQWKGRQLEYRLTLKWKQRDADACSAQGERRSAQAALERTCSAEGEQNRSAPGEQHLDFSELTDWEKQVTKADSGHASPKTAEASPDGEDLPAMMKALPLHWTERDVANLGQRLSAFMDGEQPQATLVYWIVESADLWNVYADDIHRALDAAWNRNARPGRKNRPHYWNWFYEVLRNAFIPHYSARLPEMPLSLQRKGETAPDVEQ
jgi:hypothetical protein